MPTDIDCHALQRLLLDGDPEASVEAVMEAGPVTYRPNEVT